MKNALKPLVAWAITNSVILSCFTLLAIVFEKWWIVLFSAFFVYGFKAKATEDNKEEA